MLEWLFSKRQEITSVGEDVEKREPLCTVDGNVNGVATVENSVEVPQRIKNRTAIWSSHSTSGYMKKTKTLNLKRYIHPYVHCNVIYNHQDKETTQVSIDGWIKKM